MPRVSEDHLAARRRQILDGARRCFAEYGYDKATVRRLEETTGLSRGAIFHHFRDKDALFFELAHEDAERMADVASREGLIQVMRDMLAAPDQFDWLATRLEIARKLRNDPAFHRGWTERSAELSAATHDRLRRQKTGRPAARRRAQRCAARSISTWCSTGWWPGWRPAIRPKSCAPYSISSRIRCAVRCDTAHPRPRPVTRRHLAACAGLLLASAVVGSATTAHGGSRLAQHAVDRAVRSPGRSDQRPDTGAAFVRVAEVADHLLARFVGFPHRRLPLRMAPARPG